ncbi:hypothetical protein LOD99_7448 [Oopsacas minuta]|uniref:Uncharacterized protein n=1 Tax=Oopsacas minuta TaxID=111878 RepID=A0AAV7JVD5_9METZ|nr:hypothetical protein LOD99_7448 [Oopsacas minuta]
MNKTKPKKARRECSFNIQWLTNPSNSGWLSKVNFNTARCTVCNVSFTVKYDGIKAITAHRNSEKHNVLIQSGIASCAMSSFFTAENSPEEDLIISAELTMIYHGVWSDASP